MRIFADPILLCSVQYVDEIYPVGTELFLRLFA